MRAPGARARWPRRSTSGERAPSSAGQPRPAAKQRPQRGVSCRAAAVDPATKYVWEDVRIPELQRGGQFSVEDIRVRAHEVGPNQTSGIITISNMLQECASNHIVGLRGRSEQFFAADPELARLDLIFVITRMQIRMDRYPRWGDVVRLKTYFQSEGRVGARRDWELTSAATGETFGRATSSWVMFNYKTRRLGKMPDGLRDAYRALMPEPPLHVIAPDEARLKLPEPPGGADGGGAATAPGVVVRRHTATALDMDMNGHVNNTAFLTWVLHSLPDELQLSGLVVQYEVDYKAEAVAGAEVVVTTCELKDADPVPGVPAACRQFLTSIRKAGGSDSDGNGGSAELLRARVCWQPGPP